MTPPHTELPSSHSGDGETRAPISHDARMPMFSSNIRRRTEGTSISPSPMHRSAMAPNSSLSDSWVEITSQPSSSSLASDIEVPDRLPDSQPPRVLILPQPDPPRAASAAGSSQDEYDESSSDSDRVMNSSNEDIVHSEDDDDRTALALRPPETRTIFTPQPNAFSHPPTSDRSAPNSYFPQGASIPSSFQQERRPHLQRERTSGSYQPDHDAALRASLTTLLSCAAAVRPKTDKIPERVTPHRPSIQPTTLRLIQETNTNPSSPRPAKQTKRKSRESSKDRNAKKIRAIKTASVEDSLSPTFASWIISAGVIVVFSAISFTAGYAWGKEVGLREGQSTLGGGASCGREVIRGGTRSGNWTKGIVV